MTQEALLEQLLKAWAERNHVRFVHHSNGPTTNDAVSLESLEDLVKSVQNATQPEQKPVAWMYVHSDGECEQIEYGTPPDDPSITPLYTAPPQRQPLTDEQEIELIAELAMIESSGLTDGVARLGLAGAEEALSIFNAALNADEVPEAKA